MSFPHLVMFWLEGQNRKSKCLQNVILPSAPTFVLFTRQTLLRGSSYGLLFQESHFWVEQRKWRIISIEAILKSSEAASACRKMWSEIPPPIIAGASITKFVNRDRPKTIGFFRIVKNHSSIFYGFLFHYFMPRFATYLGR